MFWELFKTGSKNWTAADLLRFVVIPTVVVPLYPLSLHLLTASSPNAPIFGPSGVAYMMLVYAVGTVFVGTVIRGVRLRRQGTTFFDLLNMVRRWEWGLIAGLHGALVGFFLGFIVQVSTGRDGLISSWTGAGFLLVAAIGAVVVPLALRLNDSARQGEKPPV